MAILLSTLSSCLFLLLISSSCASACERCVRQGKAAYSPSLAHIPAGGGVCGYGAMAMEINGDSLLLGVQGNTEEGLAVEDAFRDTKLCSSGGVRVVLTDFHRSNRTDFLLSGPAYVGLAKPRMAHQLKRMDALSIEYKRIPCDYKDRNLSILVEEQSKKPSNLVIKFLYQGGQTDILAVDVALVGSSDWRFMNWVYGPVWSTDRAPAGPLQFRAVVTGGFDGKWVWAEKEVLPVDWQPGQVYDTGARIADVARESCLDCATLDWK